MFTWIMDWTKGEREQVALANRVLLKHLNARKKYGRKKSPEYQRELKNKIRKRLGMKPKIRYKLRTEWVYQNGITAQPRRWFNRGLIKKVKVWK